MSAAIGLDRPVDLAPSHDLHLDSHARPLRPERASTISSTASYQTALSSPPTSRANSRMSPPNSIPASPYAPQDVNPMHVLAAQASHAHKEVHIIKVTDEQVQFQAGAPPPSLLHKVGRSVVRAAHSLAGDGVGVGDGTVKEDVEMEVELDVDPDGVEHGLRTPTQAAGPPPPSPPASDGHHELPPLPPDKSVSRPEQAEPFFESPTDTARVPSAWAPRAGTQHARLRSAPDASGSGAPPLKATLSESAAVTFDLPRVARTSQSSQASAGPGPSTLGRTQSEARGGSHHGRHPTAPADGGDAAEPPVSAGRLARWNTIGVTTRQRSHSQVGLGAGAPDDVEVPPALADDIQLQAEQIRRERHSKRRAAQDTAEVPVVGNVIGEGHANYVLMYNMLTGIRIAVSRCQAKIKRPLQEEDFSARHKYSFDIIGNELTPSAKYDFKFKDYAPWVFRELREDYFHLDPADYLLSLTAKYILSELGSPGKSGSFFYFSRDYRFIIKTIHHAEHKFLRAILPRYHAHVRANPHTLLSRFYGLHRVKLPHGRKIHFVIMNNLFPAHKDVHETYDLKGSTIGRMYPEDKAARNPRAVLKDLNWIRRGKSLELGPEKRALLTEQLRRDADFLRELGVMDYSLLIGIHNLARGNRDNVRRNTLKVFSPDVPQFRRQPTGGRSPEAVAMRRAMRASDLQKLGDGTIQLPEEDTGDRQHFIFYQDEGGLRATDEHNRGTDTVYYLGVIDILTPWTLTKRLENFWKGLSADRHKISPVPPDEYATRFFDFMRAVMRGGKGGAGFVAEKDLREMRAPNPSLVPEGEEMAQMASAGAPVSAGSNATPSMMSYGSMTASTAGAGMNAGASV